MWIVNLALRRPYSFVVLALFLVVLGVTAIWQMRTDIFPDIDIPVITMIWTYKGMDAEEFEKRITTFSEYALSGNVSDVKKIESQTLNGVSVIKIYFHQGANVGVAVAQVSSVAQAIRQIMPPSVQPPIILRFNASSVPIVQLSLSSDTLSESDVYDYGLWQLRTQLSTIQGLTLPAPSRPGAAGTGTSRRSRARPRAGPSSSSRIARGWAPGRRTGRDRRRAGTAAPRSRTRRSTS